MSNLKERTKKYAECWTYPKEIIDELFSDGSGTSDYIDLDNKPQINSTTLNGNQSGYDLGLLDAPSTAGTQGQVLTSDGEGGQSWQNPSGGSDPGYVVTETPLFTETVTTVAGQMGNSAQLAYIGTTTPDSMVITFDDVEYSCQRQSGNNMYYYGASDPSDWSTYPFVVLYTAQGIWMVVTETAGTHTISALTQSVDVSDNFSTAVAKSIVVPVFSGGAQGNFTCDMTFSDVYKAVITGTCYHARVATMAFNFNLARYDSNSIEFSYFYINNGVFVTTISLRNDNSVALTSDSYPDYSD